MKIILGSKSKGRRQILQSLGYDFIVMDPNIDEKSIRSSDPKKLVVLLAKAKAEALLPKIKKSALLITSDQVVCCHKHILEKPRTHREAEKFLRLHIKYAAQTITAVVVTNTQTEKQKSGVSSATVHFSKIPSEMIKTIAAQEYVLHCAGGFSLDDKLLQPFITKIDGTCDSVTGLPIKLVNRLIKALSN
ncbi:MAG: Maf family protein [Gammaproteobacteria bacterium]|nr:Maf family protein [Gammaproteobacteria bacterium]